jgi:DNA-binding transcriptional MocR family regulator
LHIVSVNSYIVTMTTWQPSLEGHSGPRYIAIAEALAQDIGEGRLAAGERLPTHRDLAWRLGVTVGTVTRAYGEAERRGLIAGEVGRGTFVRERVPIDMPLPAKDEAESGFVDLSFNLPPSHPDQRLVAEAVAEIGADGQLGRFLAYDMGLGRAEHRAAGALWMSEAGLAAAPDEVVVTAGAQHGMLLAVAALARPGDVVLTEELTYYGIKSIAALLELRLHGLPLDEHGLLPEALDAACRATGAKVLYCIPTLQNPTASVMPAERRREIARICERHDVAIVEDDVYGFLPERAPAPLSSFAPERSVYVTGLSKCVAPGLRVGYLRADRSLLERLGAGLRASTLMASPLMAEVAARLIRSGQARDMALWQRAEAKARQAIAAGALAGAEVETHPEAFHLWLKLPEPWRREVFTTEARARGVGIAPAEVFAVGRQPVPHAARICLQAARSRAQVDTALAVLSDLLARRPESHFPMV